MNRQLPAHGATYPLVQSSESQSGTTTTGEEEQSKRFFTLRKERDTIVIIILFNYFTEQLKAINRVRIGEENEVTNLIDYLTNTTVRE